MKHILNSLLGTLALAFSGSFPIGTAMAQADDAFSTRFRILAWDADSPLEVSYLSGGKLVEIDDLNPTTRSRFYAYSGTRTMLLYPSGSDINAEPKPPPLASVAFPADIKYPLVLLAPNPNGPYPYQGIAFDEDPKVFPFKSYSFVSFSKRRIATMTGEERFVLEPWKTHILTNQRKNINLKMAISVEKGTGWKIINDDFYPNWPGFRTVFFLIDTVVEGQPEIGIRSLYESEKSWADALTPPKQ